MLHGVGERSLILAALSSILSISSKGRLLVRSEFLCDVKACPRPVKQLALYSWLVHTLKLLNRLSLESILV